MVCDMFKCLVFSFCLGALPFRGRRGGARTANAAFSARWRLLYFATSLRPALCLIFFEPSFEGTKQNEASRRYSQNARDLSFGVRTVPADLIESVALRSGAFGTWTRHRTSEASRTDHRRSPQSNDVLVIGTSAPCRRTV